MGIVTDYNNYCQRWSILHQICSSQTLYDVDIDPAGSIY